MDYPHLFSPYRIKDTVFRNRIMSAPNGTKHKTVEGFPMEFEVTVYEARAKGGVSQVTTGDSGVDIRYRSQAYSRNLTFGDEDCQPGLTEVALAIRRHGAIASVELNHPGPMANPKFSGDRNPIGPGAFVRGDGYKVDEMTEQDIEEAIKAFTDAAKFAQICHFNMCMIHGGHGWLISSFFSTRTNRRTDRWGGSYENRARFAIEVCKSIRKACGDNFLIEFRISGDEFVDGGITIEDSIEFAKLLEPYIDMLHVSSAGLSTAHHAPEEANDPKFYQAIWSHCPTPHIIAEQGCYIPLAEKIKKSGVKTPIVAVGAVTTVEMAEQAIAEGKCDFVAMARAIIADTELPLKAKAGQRDEIRPCIRCEKCNDRHVSRQCTVNPEVGRYMRLLYADKHPTPRRVAIIGGGPGGMQAAITASKQGHDVTLYEKSGTLGGMLIPLSKEYLKREMAPYLDYLIRQTQKSAKILLNTEATTELLCAEKYDYIIAAIGSEPLLPKIKGIELPIVIAAKDIRSEGVELGNNVIVLGGGMAGCEIAFELSREGKKITLVEALPTLFPERDQISRNYSMPVLASIKADTNVTILVSSTCSEIKAGGAVVNGEMIYADSVVAATGMRAKRAEVDAMWNSAPEFRPIGDCSSPRFILDAVSEAFFAAMDIR